MIPDLSLQYKIHSLRCFGKHIFDRCGVLYRCIMEFDFLNDSIVNGNVLKGNCISNNDYYKRLLALPVPIFALVKLLTN